MQNNDRAKQFMPFDALKGFKEEINKRKRVIVAKRELSEDDLKAISGGVAITSVICGIIIGSAAASGAFTLGKAVHSWTNRRW